MMSDDLPRLEQVRQLPYHVYLGVENLWSAEGEASLELPVNENNGNPSGFLHGGVIYSLCDMVCYAALLSVLDEGTEAVTHDIHVSVLQAVRKGERVTFRGRIVRLGRRVAFLDAQATVGETVVATARVTKSVIRI